MTKAKSSTSAHAEKTALIQNADIQTMSSVEIAELTGKSHGHVMRDIRKILQDLSLDGSKFGATYKDASNRNKPCFALPKRECLILVSGYNVELRAKIIDRWQELETKQTAFDPASLSRLDILQLAMQAEQENQQLTAQVQTMKPKVEALDRLSTADGSLCITDAAKHLQIKPKTLFAYLQQEQWIYRRATGSNWLGYQHRIQTGLLEHKITTVYRGDGSERAASQVRIMPKGLAKLAEVFNEQEDAA